MKPKVQFLFCHGSEPPPFCLSFLFKCMCFLRKIARAVFVRKSVFLVYHFHKPLGTGSLYISVILLQIVNILLVNAAGFICPQSNLIDVSGKIGKLICQSFQLGKISFYHITVYQHFSCIHRKVCSSHLKHFLSYHISFFFRNKKLQPHRSISICHLANTVLSFFMKSRAFLLRH